MSRRKIERTQTEIEYNKIASKMNSRIQRVRAVLRDPNVSKGQKLALNAVMIEQNMHSTWKSIHSMSAESQQRMLERIKRWDESTKIFKKGEIMSAVNEKMESQIANFRHKYDITDDELTNDEIVYFINFPPEDDDQDYMDYEDTSSDISLHRKTKEEVHDDIIRYVKGHYNMPVTAENNLYLKVVERGKKR